MKFGPVPVADAAGAVLAHSLHTADGRIAKGSRLTEDQAGALAAAGHEQVVVARLEPGDVGEDDAAARLAQALAGPNLAAGRPGTGRCNLHATVRGLLLIDEDAVAAVNEVEEAITLATLRPFSVVEARQLAATVKIINFAVPGDRLEQVARRIAERPGLLRIAPFAPRRGALIQTRVAGSKPALFDKAVEVTRGRLARIGASLDDTLVCDHDAASVRGALERVRDADMILMIGASAIMDRRDVIPSAIEAAGGEIVRLGMPVDPGNLTLLARLGEADIVAMPGSARSPRLHGTDWVLERLSAGLDVTGADIAGMGVGGLLKEIPSRPSPRDRAAGAGEAKIAAVVLAAGRSSRMGARNKLLEEIDGTPMVRRSAETALASRAAPVIVVTGSRHDDVAAALDGLDVEIVHNPAFAEGMSTSLRTAIEALPATIDGVMICLGDMPAVDPATLDALIETFSVEEGAEIVVPVARGRRGNPILWARRFFPEMAAIGGDRGARSLLTRYASAIAEAEVDDPGILLDLDTPEALDRFRGGERGQG